MVAGPWGWNLSLPESPVQLGCPSVLPRLDAVYVPAALHAWVGSWVWVERPVDRLGLV